MSADLLPLVSVQNLARALTELNERGFLTIGLFDPQDPRPGHESVLRIIELGEQLGFDSAWVRSRHLQAGISSPLTVLAAIGAATSTVRLVGSTDANMFASVSAGINALFGPLHGGANEAVLKMLAQIKASGEPVAKFVERVKNKEEHVKLMYDLQVLACQTDTTRILTFQIGREQSQRSYPWIGVHEAHHDVSHHQNNPEKMDKNGLVNAYHVSLFARFLDRLRKTPDGDGSLLDNTLVIYGGAMGDGNLHNHKRCPLFLAGHGGGQFKGNLHFKAPEGKKSGIDRFTDSDAELTEGEKKLVEWAFRLRDEVLAPIAAQTNVQLPVTGAVQRVIERWITASSRVPLSMADIARVAVSVFSLTIR